jgi:MFS family permease
MGRVSSLALLVAAVLYPVWGYLYDRYARNKLLAMASFIWGSTTWLNALAPNYTTFLVTRSATGIDDASYPGLYSLLSDYFGPRLRGTVFGVIQLAQPIGFALGTILATMLASSLGWRAIFYITGAAGLVVAVLIFLGVREPQRGQAEPELADKADIAPVHINWRVAAGLLKKPSYLVLSLQGFFGVFPWQVLTFWFFRYLQTERGYTDDESMVAMLVAIATMAAGYFIGGSVGDRAFRRTPRGRALVGMVGVLAGAVFLAIALAVPAANQTLFLVPLAFTGLTMSIASPNVVAIVADVTEPEVRSTAQAVESFLENIGAVAGPWLAGVIAVKYSLHVAILTICLSTWLLCAILFGVTAMLLPKDVARLRSEMQERAGTA